MMMDLGSVSTGYCDKPWCTGKQLPLGFSLTGHFRMILMCKRKKGKKLTSGKQQAMLDNVGEYGIYNCV